MSNSIHTELPDDDWFNQDVTDVVVTNRRMSIRYIRNDIGARIRKVGLFNLSFLKNREISVRLVDISSRGVLISTPMRLTINKKVSLTIRFADFTEFDVPGIVVHKSLGKMQVYGIKFDRLNDDLADYLLKTQRKLTFK